VLGARRCEITYEFTLPSGKTHHPGYISRMDPGATAPRLLALCVNAPTFKIPCAMLQSHYIRSHPLLRKFNMNIHLSLAPIIALLAGILILAQPKLLNYIVAIYLIIIGLLGIFGGSFNLR